jgi:hypothetical protein
MGDHPRELVLELVVGQGDQLAARRLDAVDVPILVIHMICYPS